VKLASLLVGLLLSGAGWRGDGTGQVDGVAPRGQEVTWSVALPQPGNGTPVQVGDQLCLTMEPTTLACYGLADGQALWQAEHAAVDALPPEEAQVLRPQVEAYASRLAQLPGQRRALAAALRRARTGDAAAVAEAEQLRAQMDEVRELERQVGWASTQVPLDLIGYASPSPASDGQRVFALFGNGVLAAYSLNGELQWRRYLGRPPKNLRGYTEGATSSLQVRDGRLYVGYGQLMALDPATGEALWTREGWLDYGTPALAEVAGRPVVGLPTGEILDARTGAELASGLGDLWYIAPHFHGDQVFYIGGKDPSQRAQQEPAKAAGYGLAFDGDTLVVTPLWEHVLDTPDVFYTQPVSLGEGVFSITRSGELRIFHRATGEALAREDLFGALQGLVWSSPLGFTDGVLLASEGGQVAIWDGASSQLDPVLKLDARVRATPLVLPDAVVLRGLNSLTKVAR